MIERNIDSHHGKESNQEYFDSRNRRFHPHRSNCLLSLDTKAACEGVDLFISFGVERCWVRSSAAVASEESLSKYAEECIDDYDGDLDQAIAELRWGGIEDGWYQSKDKDFRNANGLLDIAEQIELYPEYDGTLEKIGLSVIRRMDAEAIFGPPEVRERIVIGICHTGGDNSQEQFLEWASAVNPPSVIKRLKSQLQ